VMNWLEPPRGKRARSLRVARWYNCTEPEVATAAGDTILHASVRCRLTGVSHIRCARFCVRRRGPPVSLKQALTVGRKCRSPSAGSGFKHQLLFLSTREAGSHLQLSRQSRVPTPLLATGVLEPFYRQLEFTRQPQSGVQLRLTRETQQSQA